MFPAPETGCASRSIFTKVAVVPKAPPCVIQGCPKRFRAALPSGATLSKYSAVQLEGRLMAWTTPILVEICIGLEINGYLPAEF